MNRVVILVVAVVAIIGGYFVFTQMRPSLSAENEQVTSTPTQQVSVTTAHVDSETATHKIDVQYPRFGVATIDTQVQKFVDDTVAEFKTTAANPPEMAASQNELVVRFEQVYIGPDVISFKLLVSQDTGGAHPNTIISGLNFDRTTGVQLLQNDAFRMIGKTVSEVSAEATTQLKAKLGDSIFEEGANTNPENFSSFVISANTVTFIFQPYQVAAYAAGAPEVSFPRK